MLLEKTKEYIELIKREKYTREQVLNVLTSLSILSREEKNFIFLYCFPRPLLDRELPPRVVKEHYLRGDISNRGSLVPNNLDVSLILEAGKTEQYGRFIKHLMNAFCDNSKVFKVSDNSVHDCPICGKKIFGEELWKISENIDTSKEYLAFGSTGSSITLCLDCLVQLNSAKETIDFVDPDFFDWSKKFR